MKLNSFDGLSLRLENCPDSVALFTDKQLRDFARRDPSDPKVQPYVLGEMLVREWLYCNGQTASLTAAIDALAQQLNIEDAVKHFRSRIRPLRFERWPVKTKPIETAFATSRLSEEQEDFHQFVRDRITAFLTCDGVIPAVIEGEFEDSAIPIPFTVHRNQDKGEIIDRKGKRIEGWMREAKNLWKALRYRFDVHLLSAFGDHAEFKNDKEAPLVDGGSFALPILFAASRTRMETVSPLDVLCTGEVDELYKIRAIDGRDEKAKLADRIGAKVFAAPGEGDPWFISEGMDLKSAIPAIWGRLGKPETEIRRINAHVFTEGDSFDGLIEELTTTFVGREPQVTDMLSRIGDKSKTGGLIWIGGNAGCGKSAFMAELARQSVDRQQIFTIPYFFFDPTRRISPARIERLDDFFRHVVTQITTTYGIGLDDVRGDNEYRCNLAIARFHQQQPDRLVLLVDGVDEVQEPLSALAQMAQQASSCVWVFASQETDKTEALRCIIPERDRFPLGGLKENAIHQMISNHVAVSSRQEEMNEPLGIAIAKKAEGLPQYVSLALYEWDQVGNEMDPARLPTGLPAYCGRIIDRLVQGDRNQRWRGCIIDILALLATTRQRTPLTAGSIAAMLDVYFQPYSVEDVRAALFVCKPILRSVRLDAGEDLRWTFSHSSFREFVLDDNPGGACDSAQQAWLKMCRLWDSAPEPGLRDYALQFLGNELLDSDADGDAALIEMAKNDKFLNAQSDFLGLHFALETLRCAIKSALRLNNLPDAAVLTLERATRTEGAYAGWPLGPLKRLDNTSTLEERRNAHRRALGMIEHIENQNDRTLWHFAIAVWHANGQRPWLAAQVLDSAIPESALQEKLTGGASLCAAVLLCLLTHIHTRRFRWETYVSRLDDASKLEVVSLLLVREEYSLRRIWQILNSISDQEVQDKARTRVIKEVASYDVRLARDELDNIDDKRQRAWAAVEVIAAYSRMKDLWQLNAVFNKHVPDDCVRQQTKALCYKAVCLRRLGERRKADRLVTEGFHLIRSVFATNRDEQAKAFAELGKTLAEVSDPAAKRAFDHARNLAIRLPQAIRRAKALTTIVSCLAAVNVETEIANAVDQVLSSLTTSGSLDADPTKVRLMRALGRHDYLPLAHTVLATIDDPSTKARAAAWLYVYYCRFGSTPSKALLKKAPDLPTARAARGVLALYEAIKGNVHGALKEILLGLSYCKAMPEQRQWGSGRILCAAAHVIRKENPELARCLFRRAADMIERMGAKSWRGRHFLHLAERSAQSDLADFALEMLGKARAPEHFPQSKAREVRLLAEIGAFEAQYKIGTQGNSTLDDLIRDTDAIPTDTLSLPRKFERYLDLLPSLAKVGRFRTLEKTCIFVYKRVANPNQYHLPRKMCSSFAARFAEKLTKNALELDGFRDWASKFEEVCRAIEQQKGEAVPVPPEAMRSAVLNSDLELEEAMAAAERIPVEETRSTTLRDLAIRAVVANRTAQIPGLLSRITHERSQHLPDIGREVARQRRSGDDVLLHRLVMDCSEYPDAAHRIVSSLIRFYRPDENTIQKLLCACGLFGEESTQLASSH